jgi:nitrogen regulatory protein P-II 1
MKQVKVFLHPHRAADVLQALRAAGFKRVSLFDVKGQLQALSAREQRYSVELGEPIVNELQMELFCEDADVKQAVELIRQTGRTGRPDAGWIFVSSVEEAYRIEGPAEL